MSRNSPFETRLTGSKLILGEGNVSKVANYGVLETLLDAYLKEKNPIQQKESSETPTTGEESSETGTSGENVFIGSHHKYCPRKETNERVYLTRVSSNHAVGKNRKIGASALIK